MFSRKQIKHTNRKQTSHLGRHRRPANGLSDIKGTVALVKPVAPNSKLTTSHFVSGTRRDGKEHTEIRYYILSRYLSGEKFGTGVRAHWGVENNLHWQLDVTFQEDQCRIRKGHADTNFSLLRRTALSLLKNEKTAKVGIKNKRLTAAWNEQYLSQVLFTK